MAEPYPVIDLSVWTPGEVEPGGAEEKRWFTAPETSPLSGRWLFKPRRVKTQILSEKRRARGDQPDELVRGEDWAEKISYELARLMHVPAAVTELASAVRSGTGDTAHGSISREMRPHGWMWTPGAALLAERDPDFDSETCRGHSLADIRAALADHGGPVASDYAEWPAFDVFVGYLLLDAWIANSDRHAHNWGVLQNPEDGTVTLGPSFDHGSALASGVDETYRSSHVQLGRVPDWCAKGKTKRFDAGKPLDMVELARTALSLTSKDAAAYWPEQLRAVDLDLCGDILAAIPNLSATTRIFVSTVVDTNRRRLLDGIA